MKRICISMLFIITAGILAISCGGKSDNASECGRFDSGVYTNKCLGFQLSVPNDWTVLDQKQANNLIAAGGTIITGGDESLQSAVDTVASINAVLLVAFKYPIESMRSDNVTLSLLAFDLKESSKIKRGSDYLEIVKQGLAKTKMTLSYEPIGETMIDGISFDVLTIAMDMGQGTASQRCYAAVVKDHLIIISSTTYSDINRFSEVQQILDTMKFDKEET